MHLSRYYHTLRHLRLRQIVGQVRHRIHRHLIDPARFLGAAAPAPLVCQWPPEAMFAPPRTDNAAERILEGQLSFLNQECVVGWPPDWDGTGRSRLWQYNLHYFDWLWALEYPEARAAVRDWLYRHPRRRAAVGWEPYPISLRLMNWCCLFWGRFRVRTEADPNFQAELGSSIVNQAWWLARHLETHLMGNHLFENAAALAFVGSCFGGEPAARWRRTGCRLLERELKEQILPDGMHFERSPMYHLRTMQVLEWLLATGNPGLEALIAEPLERMRSALPRLTHPDGRIALLNDSALDIYRDPASFMPPGGTDTPPAGAWALAQAGYYGWSDLAGTYLICDAGDIGPDYIPGHAHADLFSFELSLRGHRVIVDAGVYDYLNGEMRRYCRSTRAHNTVEVNDQDQCECWGAFRVARRGYPRDVQFKPAAEGFSLSGWHDGYHRLPGRPTHHRSFEWRPGLGLRIQDRVTAERPVKAVSRLHFHPDCRVCKIDVGRIGVAYPGGEFTIEYVNHGRLVVENSCYCPGFNIKIENSSIGFLGQGTEILFEMIIKPS